MYGILSFLTYKREHAIEVFKKQTGFLEEKQTNKQTNLEPSGMRVAFTEYEFKP